MIERFYIFQQSAGYSVWSKGSIWMYVFFYGLFNDAVSSFDYIA